MMDWLGTGPWKRHRTEQKKARGYGPTGRIASFLLLCLTIALLLLADAYASGGSGAEGSGGGSWLDFLWRLVNFLVLIGVIYWLLSKKIKEYFSGRREGIKQALAEAVAAREQSEKKFQEYSTKLDKATGEIEQISIMIESQGEAEKVRIIEDARKTAEKIKEDTQARMDQEFTKASQQLRTEAVRLSTQMAEEILKKNIQAADHEAMVKDYIEKVVTKN
jgi:F-type H+-transporting ATPase subunit b